MTPADYAEALEASTKPARRKAERERLSLEFSQPLVQSHRRKRPRKRADRLPLFDQQLNFPEEETNQ